MVIHNYFQLIQTHTDEMEMWTLNPANGSVGSLAQVENYL